MIHTITTSTGRTVYVVPDNEPVFQESEIKQMTGMEPDHAELIALVKEIFPGAKVEKVNHLIPEKEAQQMAMFNFNVDEAPEYNDFTPIPEGEYQAIITDSDMLPTKTGGGYLKLTYTVQGGEHHGRMLFDNLNVNNSNETAVEIAMGTLRRITECVGLKFFRDTVELHNIPLKIKVRTEIRKDNGEVRNVIKGYSPVQSATVTPISKPKAAAAPAPPAAKPSVTPPWQNKKVA